MKRALFLCPSPFEVGTYFRALAFAKKISETFQLQVDLLCSGEKRETILRDRVSIETFTLSGINLLPLRGWNTGEWKERIGFVQKHQNLYRLLYSFEYQPNVQLVARSLPRNLPIYHVNDWCDWYAGRHHRMKGITLLQKCDAWLEERPRKKADLVTTICTSLYDRARDSGVSEQNLILIREGAQADGELLQRNDARRALGIKESTLVIVGMADSDQAFFEKSAEELLEKKEDVRVILFGKCAPSQCSAVEFHGRVSDSILHQWLCAADQAWVPLRDTLLNAGRLPHKIGHFRMYGLPVVSNPVSDLPLLNDPGLSLIPFESQSFAQRTMQIAGSNASRESFLNSASKLYSWDSILAPLLERIGSAID